MTDQTPQSKMDAAAAEALGQLSDELNSMTEPEHRGATLVMTWLAAWYGQAGYKRLLSPKFNGLIQRFTRGEYNRE